MKAAKLFVGAFALALTSTTAFAQQTPAELLGPLFQAVQTKRIFPDGKTFVDAVPKREVSAILAEYERNAPADPEALRAFVLANFTVPGVNDHKAADLRRHVRDLWPMLVRPPVSPARGSSALRVSAPHVVPGGRFREIYYWDSYFTMLGLAVDGQQPLVESMLTDFTEAIEQHGHIPNGMRTYYLSRSQPPFFALMLDLSRDTEPATAARRLAALRREHAYWMKGATCLDATGACLRVVRMPDGTLLNRYFDDYDTPRDESYAEDAATAADAQIAGRNPRVVWRNLRAGAESGWDFSSRWLADGRSLTTVRTIDIVPADLNSLMFAMEERIAARCGAAGDAVCASEFAGLAKRRKAAITRYLWDDRGGRFADWDRIAQRPTPVLTAATLFPLFVGAATPAQAKRVAATVRRTLLAPGGLRTTTNRTGQQWDSPNGWAPLQWVAIDGLARYGHVDLAREIARRWADTVTRTYSETGKMLEKYDIEERKPGGGGEYPTQDGFGWTNGVFSAIDQRWPDLAR